jgi:hypothetical protein
MQFAQKRNDIHALGKNLSTELAGSFLMLCSLFSFPRMKYGKYWFHLQKKIIANFYVLGIFIPKKRVKSEKKICLSRGVAVVASVSVSFWMKFEAQLAQLC